jgi:hypothetical protein
MSIFIKFVLSLIVGFCVFLTASAAAMPCVKSTQERALETLSFTVCLQTKKIKNEQRVVGFVRSITNISDQPITLFIDQDPLYRAEFNLFAPQGLVFGDKPLVWESDAWASASVYEKHVLKPNEVFKIEFKFANLLKYFQKNKVKLHPEARYFLGFSNALMYLRAEESGDFFHATKLRSAELNAANTYMHGIRFPDLRISWEK